MLMEKFQAIFLFLDDEKIVHISYKQIVLKCTLFPDFFSLLSVWELAVAGESGDTMKSGSKLLWQ